jgi:hypothetical protein
VEDDVRDDHAFPTLNAIGSLALRRFSVPATQKNPGCMGFIVFAVKTWDKVQVSRAASGFTEE